MAREIRKPMILVDDEGIRTKAYYMDEIERDNKVFVAVALDPEKTANSEDGIQMAIFRVDTDDEGNNALSALDPGQELDILREIFFYRIQKVFQISPEGEFPFEFDISEEDEDNNDNDDDNDDGNNDDGNNDNGNNDDGDEEITIDVDGDVDYNKYTSNLATGKQKPKTSESNKEDDKDLSSLFDEIDNI